MFSEYKILAIFIVVVCLLIGFFINWGTAACFVVGALFSIGAGFFGMNVLVDIVYKIIDPRIQLQ